jgi:thiol:disulfide interchange protein
MPGAPYVGRRVNKQWKVFAIKVGAWVIAALAAQFLTTIFLGGPPPYLVPGILVLGALQIGLLDRTTLPGGDGKMLKRGIALLMVAFAGWFASEAVGEEKIPWQPYSEDVFQAAVKGNRPVMINFTSSNCPPCYEMKHKVFSNARVANAAKEFLPLRADLTVVTPSAAALAEKFNLEAFPTVVFIGRDGKEHLNLRLVGFENARFFTERVEQAR